MNLKDFAKALNLSQTTVSRALNGYPEVSEKTRLRVVEAARQYGYRPNHAARGLATGQARTVGAVLRTTGGMPSDPHYMEFLTGVGEVAQERGYDILLSPATVENEHAAYERLAATGLVDGMIISSPAEDDPRISWVKACGIPFIVHGRAPAHGAPYPFLDIDNRQAFYDATRLLLNLGHKRIALLNGEPGLTYAEHREQGLVDAFAEDGLKPDRTLMFRAEMTEAEGDRITRELLALAEPPTAIICSSLVMALGCTRAIYRHGLEVGRDISVIAHDDVIPFMRPDNFRTPLTTTRSSIRAAGRRIMERLVARLEPRTDETDEATVTEEIWPVELVVRQSVGTCRKG